MCSKIFLVFWAAGVLKFGSPIYAQESRDGDYRVESDPDCILDKETERVQVAYVVDNTGSNDMFIKILADSMEDMMNKINEIHEDTEFALTCHANWPQEAYDIPRAYTGEEDCYSRKSTFTTNVKEVIEKAKKVTALTGPTTGSSEENGVAALAFAASDKKLGWVMKNIDNKNRRVHRFLLFVTDQWSVFELRNPGGRQPFKGDGNDTCSTSLPPPLSKLGEILMKTDTRIIGVYLTTKSYRKHIEKFNEAGFGKRHSAENFADLKNNPKEFKNKLSQYVADEIRKFLRCVFADPPAFNTLGL